jgi:hypothetical protein
LISIQEHQTWHVLLAPSGHDIGIDMHAALSLASARGYDLDVLSELLPMAEAGLVAALSIDRAGEKTIEPGRHGSVGRGRGQ